MSTKRRRPSRAIEPKIPTLIISVIAAPFFLIYPTYGLCTNAVFLPGRFNGIVFHGISAWFVAAAYYCLAVIFSSICIGVFVPHTLRNRLMALDKWALRGCAVLLIIGFLICFWTRSGEYTDSQNRTFQTNTK